MFEKCGESAQALKSGCLPWLPKIPSILQQDGGVVKVGGSTNVPSSQTNAGSSAAAAVLRSDSGSGGPPPNVNIASLNLPGEYAIIRV